MLDPLDLLALVALLPVHTEATARDLATATPDTTAPRLLVPAAPVPAILKIRMALLALVRIPQVQAARAQVLTAKRRTPRALDRLRRVDTLRRRTVDMDDLPRVPLVIPQDRMASRRLPRGTKHGRLDVTLVM